MSRIGSVMHRSFRATIDPCLKTRSIPSYVSCMSISRTSFNCLPTSSSTQSSNRKRDADWCSWQMGNKMNNLLPLSSTVWTTRSPYGNPLIQEKLYLNCSSFSTCISKRHIGRAYSSQAGGNQDGIRSILPTAAAASSNGNSNDSTGYDWADILHNAHKSAVDVAVNTGTKVKAVADEIVPYMQQFYDANPYPEKVIVSVGGTLISAVLAWIVLPKILRRIHKYATQTRLALLSGNSTKEQVSYEKSMWSALEDPSRYLVTFMAFSQLGVMIAPSTSEYLPQVWRCATVLSFVWFTHRLKTSLFQSAMANQGTVGLDKDKLLSLEKMSSVGLLVLGAMALAEACGVPLQSLLTVGGIGGVATAFASRDILGNFFSGISLQFTKPFSVGDHIKAGSIEGQVVEMGLTTTSLLNPEKNPVTVPNSLFSSQAIVNKSRALWRAVLTKIPIHLDDMDKIPDVSNEIKSMLQSNPNVFLEKDAPYCFLSRIDSSFMELTLGCNLKRMRKDESAAAEQEILLQAVRIIKKHGAQLGSFTV